MWHFFQEISSTKPSPEPVEDSAVWDRIKPASFLWLELWLFQLGKVSGDMGSYSWREFKGGRKEGRQRKGEEVGEEEKMERKRRNWLKARGPVPIINEK